MCKKSFKSQQTKSYRYRMFIADDMTELNDKHSFQLYLG